MSWSAHIQHTAGGLAIVFSGPLSRLDMSANVAQHFARLLAAEASSPGVVSALEAENGSHAAVMRGSRKQPRIYSEHPLCCDCDNCLNGGT